jgi:hypothetical protein
VQHHRIRGRHRYCFGNSTQSCASATRSQNSFGACQQQQQAQPQQPEVAADDSQNMTMSDSESVSYLGANAGIDPQFFEVIDENLPILLTPTGLEKWNNATLTLPEPAPAKTKVELSAETTALCEQRKQVMIPLIQQRIQELLQQAPNVAP